MSIRPANEPANEPQSCHDTKPFLVSLLIAFLIAEGLYLWAHARGMV